ncbi:MAG: DUF2147 domain-containing protein [Flavobacteriaceae bacterium]|jgi:uncharacterized protein (DUF2147 family)|nr:DUF2147 domain-containing protein [Flavobacteriaceae bacterium]
MRKKIFSGILLVVISYAGCFAQSFTGKWKNIDDETGKPKAVIEIFKKGDHYYGKILELLIKPTNNNCVKCTDDRKNKPLLGLEMLRSMTLEGKELTGGKILDPSKGKEYKCTISFENSNKLKVRGYIGVSLIGRNQYWERMK